jgi:LuxR family maltose regulon positive regulatory protein
MPYFHRSSRDFSDMSVNMDNNIELCEKSFGDVIGKDFPVIKECLYAGLHYEKGNIDDAHEHALAACANIPDGGSPEIMFCAMMILASVLFADGQKADANKIIDNTKDMIERYNALYLLNNLRAYQFRLKLIQGDKDAAMEWLQEYDGGLLDELTFFELYKHFTTARAYIVMGNYANAVLFLKKLLELSGHYRRTLDIIESRILLAIVYWKKGQGGQSIALNYLEQAVVTAHEYGYTQIFANEGAELVHMLQRLQKRAVQKSYTGDIPAGFVKRLYIAAVAGAKRSKGLTGGRIPKGLTFTDKQKNVMNLLCAGYSRNEIADRIKLKPYTVKSHIELIYKKLDVSNSVEAILKIKESGILN